MRKPSYRVVGEQIRRALQSEGELVGVQLVDGAKMPTEDQLAAHFHVSRNTIRAALQQAAAEGLTESRGRNGIYVRRLDQFGVRMEAERVANTRPGDVWANEVAAAGRTQRQEFSFRMEPAGQEVAELLQIDARDLVVVRSLLQYIDDTPWSIQESYYPHDVARECEIDVPDNIAEGTLRRMAAHGVVQDQLHQEVTARPATDEERETFQIADGVPLLVYRRVAGAGGRVVRFTEDVLPADRNRLVQDSTGNFNGGDE